MKRWYLVHTQPRREFLARDNLVRQGFDVFIPCLWKTVRHARKLSKVKAALFPGYLFTAFDPGEVRWRSIDGTIGVLRLVKAGDRPQAAPSGLVEGLITATDGDGVYQAPSDALEPGQAVRIISGPFADHLAEVDRLSGEGRVRLLLRLMDGSIPIDAPESSVRIVGQPHTTPLAPR